MATIRFFQQTQKGKQRADGTFPISMVITNNRRRKYFNIDRACLPGQWNADKQTFTKVYPGYRKENEVLLSIRKEAMDIIREFEYNGIPFSFERLTSKFRKLQSTTYLKDYFAKWIERKKQEGKFKTAEQWETALNRIKDFCTEKNQYRFDTLTFNAITVLFLNGFEHFLRSRGCQNGAISVYMRGIRSLVNKAIGEGITNTYHFSRGSGLPGYKIPSSQARKRAISAGEIEKIESLIYANYSNERLARDLFIFSYYTWGVSFVDLAHLKPKDIANGYLRYTRQKTGSKLSVFLVDQAKRVLKYYVDQMAAGQDYIFPILSADKHMSASQQYNRIRKVQKAVNSALRRIVGPHAGIQNPEELTFYVARHSAAANARDNGLDVHEIQAVMGHKNISTTQVYLKSLNESQLKSITQKAFGSAVA